MFFPADTIHKQRQVLTVIANSGSAAGGAGAAAVPPPQPANDDDNDDSSKNKKSNNKPVIIFLGVAATVAALAAGGYTAVTSGAAAPALDAAREFLSSSVLAKSGFFAAFSLIFASEIGDKTFFIAALLAMRCGKMISFIGSTAALAAMTVISVAIGYAVKSVPAVVKSSEVLGQWAGAALLLYFGVRTLRDAWQQSDDADEELGEAVESVEEAEKEGTISRSATIWKSLLEVASLIFVAEWGDRSMLATIALGAAQSPLGVAGGAILGHAVATLIAVVGGAVLSKHISEKTVAIIGGILFIVFAAATALGLF